jgi:hypothetical protein
MGLRGMDGYHDNNDAIPTEIGVGYNISECDGPLRKENMGDRRDRWYDDDDDA